MKRKPGYYWIKYKGEWKICEYVERPDKSYAWSSFGTMDYPDYYVEGLFDEVHEYRIEPPEIPTQQEYDKWFGPNSPF